MDIKNIGTTAMFNLAVAVLVFFLNCWWDSKRGPLGCFMIYKITKELEDSLKDLEARVYDNKERIAMAKREQKTGMHEVQAWLGKANSMMDEAKEIENQKTSWIEDYGSFHKLDLVGIWRRYKIGKKAAEKIKEVKELHARGGFSTVAASLPPPPVQDMPCNTKVRAMDSKRDEVLLHLNNGGVKIIGIWGMGGVGKTTLLQMINNYFANSSPSSSFDHVIFVVVSRNINFQELRKKIAKRLGLSSWECDDIFNFLKNKTVLLLLDDIWEHVDLSDLGISLSQHECNIVFTTRKFDVCSFMDAQATIEVECLKYEEAWDLFKEKAGERNIKSGKRIVHLAEEIVRECCGLPLALITIGRAMSTKKEGREWEHALNSLRKSQHHNIPGMEETMFPKLELSYQSLQNDTMRNCFLSCSLWPEDHNIEKYKLVDCWLGLGLIDNYDEINEAYDRGYSIVGGLIDTCLLELGSEDDCVKMHDVMRDMALWIASEYGKNEARWIVRAGVQQKVCETKRWQRTCYVSLMYNDIEALPEQHFDCPDLLVLMLQENCRLNKIPDGFFKSMLALTYLDMSWTSIKELPVEIGELVNLKFLNLTYTSITSLPKELGDLGNLKYLILQNTSIVEIPKGVLSCLQALEVLDLFYCYEAWEEESYGGFEELEKLDSSLKGLGITVNTVPTLERLSKFTHVSTMAVTIQSLVAVTLELLSPGCLGSHNTGGSLRKLAVRWCGSLEMLKMNPSQAEGLPRLEHFVLWDLPQLHDIEWNGVAPRELLLGLRSLEIIQCNRLRNVSWVSQLPCLEYLYIAACNEIEGIVDNVEASSSAAEVSERVAETILIFPQLRRLELSQLPNLGSICSTPLAFPSLTHLTVQACPCLKKLPFSSQIIPNEFKEINGEGEWWRSLGWEDAHIESSLEKHFKERNE